MIVLAGQKHEVPGVETICWLDDPKRVPQTHKTNPRTTWIRSIVVHTVRGVLCTAAHPGSGNPKAAFAEARYQVTGKRQASFDAIVGGDGVVLWQNDAVDRFTWHAMAVNPYSLGIELYQDPDGTIYEATLEAAATLIHWLCAQLGIQRQTPWSMTSLKPHAGRIERLERGGADLVGVYGHRNVWRRNEDGAVVPMRGAGDPGDLIFETLAWHRSFEAFDFTGSDPEDKRVWAKRQAALGLVADGIPGPLTVKALKATGHPDGLWSDSV